MIRYPAILLITFALTGCTPADEPNTTITVIGTNDVHGALVPRDDTGGLVALSAYVNALRAAREADGGALLLLDAGDMWQGTLESNLSEGETIVEAYNRLGYDAVALGNFT